MAIHAPRIPGSGAIRLRELLTAVLVFGESPLSVLPALRRVMARFGTVKRFERDRRVPTR